MDAEHEPLGLEEPKPRPPIPAAVTATGRYRSSSTSGPSDLAPIPRLALRREDAAKALSMSLDSFERHVEPSIAMCRLGRMRRVPVAELERWLEQNAERTLA